jgi:hypothetical protein
MRGKVAKELRRMANFTISHDPEVRKSREYKLAKQQYKMLKNIHKNI